jgi:hypothetical protein
MNAFYISLLTMKSAIAFGTVLDPSLGDMPQGALSVSNKHDVIPLGNLLRQIQHTEFYLRHITGTGTGEPNLEHDVPNLKHGVPFKNQRLYSVCDIRFPGSAISYLTSNIVDFFAID